MLFKRITKERNCPVCKNSAVYRIKRAGLPVKVACKLLNLRPHWCPDCDFFYLGPRHSKEMRVEESFQSAGRPQQQGPNQTQAGSLPS